MPVTLTAMCESHLYHRQGRCDFTEVYGQGRVAHICNPSSRESEAGGSHGQGSLEYIMRPDLKTNMAWGPVSPYEQPFLPGPPLPTHHPPPGHEQ